MKRKSSLIGSLACKRKKWRNEEVRCAPFIALVSGGTQVMGSFGVGHAVPDLVAVSIAGLVIGLGRDYEDDVVDDDCEENFVASAIKRLIFITVDL